MTTYEIKVDGVHAATVTVKEAIEICDHVAAIRAVWDDPIVEIIDGERFEWFADPDEGGVEITAEIVRMY